MFSQISNYFIDTTQLLGQGAYGKVFLALKKDDPNKYCAKFVNVNSIKNNKELKIIDYIKDKQNQNIVRVHYCDQMEEKKMIVIIMEKCESDLKKEIIIRQQSNKMFTEQEAVQIMKQLFNGYKILYQYQIVHRDIKPANILIEKGIYKIADFGISKIYQSDQNFLNITKNGTPEFMAPELTSQYLFKPSDLQYIKENSSKFQTNINSSQLNQQSSFNQFQNIISQNSFEEKQKKQKLLHKIDIYSFGILFYLLLTGSYPFETNRDSIMEFHEKLKTIPFQFPPQFNISQNNRQLVERMITYSPIDRIDFPTIAQQFGMRNPPIFNLENYNFRPFQQSFLQNTSQLPGYQQIKDWLQTYRNMFIEKCCQNNNVIKIYRNYCDLCLNLAILMLNLQVTLDQINDYIIQYKQSNKGDIEFQIEAKLHKTFYIIEYCRILKSQFINKIFDYQSIKTYGEEHLKFMFISQKLIKGIYKYQGLSATPQPIYIDFVEQIKKDQSLTKEQYKKFLDETI
ncbi:unnamed protein product [Paramecium primaurelia]|uniref:Protein kinase domain-containing protein n=1 Tax=Paramecium primaurelia TaxID=5886 RepID=A0A8S1L6L8_PARPR|nr:unnamed protein product [Paramecium primaurelia]